MWSLMNEKMKAAQEEIINEFNRFDDWFQAYHYLIGLGKNLEGMDDALKTDDNSIGGCQSQVWLHAEIDNNSVHFTADSDSQLIKGLLSLLLRVVNDAPVADIIDCDLYFLKEIGLNEHLSPSRSHGLNSIINQLKTIRNSSED